MARKRLSTDTIVVHCAATKANMDIGAKEIRRWHQDKGWEDIGYHQVIRRNGIVEDGRPLDVVGAHVAGHNARSIGICLVGGIDNAGRPQTNFTPEQYTSLAVLLRTLKRKYPGTKIIGHRDLDPGKACPTFDVAAWVRENV